MRYQITYFMAQGARGEFSFVGSFDEIRMEAREAVHSGECQRVEVRDPQGTLRYHYPRMSPSVVTRAAQIQPPAGI